MKNYPLLRLPYRSSLFLGGRSTVSAMISLWNHPQDYSAEKSAIDLYFYFGVAQNHNEL
ncbi:MAG: hypothetical protein ACPF9N_07160 [Flavobacteriaceae bacterium]